MPEYDVYKYIELIIFLSYMIFIFLLVQIGLLWKYIDKNEMKAKINESLIKRNFIYVFFLSIFYMVPEFLEGILPNATIDFEFLDMMALVTLVLFAYDWYSVLKTCAYKKSLPQASAKGKL
jgi:hypothetical protein